MRTYGEIKTLTEVVKEKQKEEKKFCKLCQKPETRDECSYGEKAWDRFAVPIKSVKREETEFKESAAWTKNQEKIKKEDSTKKEESLMKRKIQDLTLKHQAKRLETPVAHRSALE